MSVFDSSRVIGRLRQPHLRLRGRILPHAIHQRERGFHPKGPRILPQKFVVPATQQAAPVQVAGVGFAVTIAFTVAVAVAASMPGRKPHGLLFVPQVDSPGFRIPAEHGVKSVLGLVKGHQLGGELAAAIARLQIGIGDGNAAVAIPRRVGDRAGEPRHHSGPVQLLREGAQFFPVGGSDSHQSSTVGSHRKEIVGYHVGSDGGFRI
mmetsp:Transcript_28122/g.76290  ORF Transcript_28122/g.76290 Transcript_28122/m.76290 type:complete len:207 (+) Transcript_28122:707-1327(+)